MHRSELAEVANGKEERNPLAPCGSCSEWLKKIAEVNPDFRVVTFTDEALTGVYVEYVV